MERYACLKERSWNMKSEIALGKKMYFIIKALLQYQKTALTWINIEPPLHVCGIAHCTALHYSILYAYGSLRRIRDEPCTGKQVKSRELVNCCPRQCRSLSVALAQSNVRKQHWRISKRLIGDASLVYTRNSKSSVWIFFVFFLFHFVFFFFCFFIIT